MLPSVQVAADEREARFGSEKGGLRAADAVQVAPDQDLTTLKCRVFWVFLVKTSLLPLHNSDFFWCVWHSQHFHLQVIRFPTLGAEVSIITLIQ